MAFSFALCLFAGINLNLILCFALGMHSLISLKTIKTPFKALYPWVLLCIVSPLLWLFLEKALFRLWYWFPMELVLYPLTLFVFFVLERCTGRLFSSRMDSAPSLFRAGSPFGGLVFASVFLTCRFALRFGEAFCLSIAFSAGAYFAGLLVREIRRRFEKETVPRWLRGDPAAVISMGLLSLVASSSSLLMIKALLR